LFTIAAVVGNGSFTVLLMNNGEIVYIAKGIATAATTITITITSFLFTVVGCYGYIKGLFKTTAYSFKRRLLSDKSRKSVL
jgi:hypothetical protein